jgi:hypothetical protein
MIDKIRNTKNETLRKKAIDSLLSVAFFVDTEGGYFFLIYFIAIEKNYKLLIFKLL